MPTHYLFGLGNPGARYEKTRHNVGFAIVDRLARELEGGEPRWERGRGGLFVFYRYRGEASVRGGEGETRADGAGARGGEGEARGDEAGARGDGIGYSFCLIKPLTFMNLCGRAIERLSTAGIDSREIVVLYDNLDLAPGAIRLKLRGTAGGHNGIASAIGVLGTTFARIAIGIGRPQYSGQVERYVIAPPTAEEGEAIERGVRRVCESYLHYPSHSFAKRMEYLHRRDE